MASIPRNEATIEQIHLHEDAILNPLTGQAWPEGHDDLLSKRRELPVYQQFPKILDTYHENQVFVLSSETGSGKSTQVPQLILHDEYGSGLQVVCTQPRRLAATSLASRVSAELGVTLGEEVGYKIGGESQLNMRNKRTRLVYMTEGSLLNKYARDNRLSEFACVILDEAHERSVEMDLLMALLKRTLRLRDDLKVIIMSATLDANLFQRYFNQCPLVNVTGHTYPVDIRYVAPHQYTCPDFRILAASVVVDIHKRQGPGDILVFLPGQGDIDQVGELVSKHTDDLDVLPLYAQLSSAEKDRALSPSSLSRKCILATNMAETSLTIDGIVYVVDIGLARPMLYNPRLGMEMHGLQRISQASARQRTGRAGRTRAGVCYRLYSEQEFDDMAPSTEPAIRQEAVHSALLKIHQSRILRVIDFDWVDAPHPEGITRAAQDLRDWGFLREDGKLTTSGICAARLPMDPIWFRAIEEGEALGCSLEILDIAVLCSINKSVFARPPGYQQLADSLKVPLAVPSDHLSLANAFNMYTRERKRQEKDTNCELDLRTWCRLHFLNFEALEQAYSMRQRLGGQLVANRSSVAVEFSERGALDNVNGNLSSVTNETNVRKALARAFCTQIAIRHGDDNYRTVHENIDARLEPNSVLVKSNYTWIVYTELKMTGNRVYLQTATPIKAEWLVDLPYFKDDRLPLTGDGKGWRQPQVKASLDSARAARSQLEALPVSHPRSSVEQVHTHTQPRASDPSDTFLLHHLSLSAPHQNAGIPIPPSMPDLFDLSTLPDEWKDDPQSPESNIARFLADYSKYKDYFDSHGVSRHRIVTDASGTTRLQPRRWASLRCVDFADLAHELETDFITLTREAVSNHQGEPIPGQLVFEHKKGGSEFTTSSVNTVAAHEAQGWKI